MKDLIELMLTGLIAAGAFLAGLLLGFLLKLCLFALAFIMWSATFFVVLYPFGLAPIAIGGQAVGLHFILALLASTLWFVFGVLKNSNSK